MNAAPTRDVSVPSILSIRVDLRRAAALALAGDGEAAAELIGGVESGLARLHRRTLSAREG